MACYLWNMQNPLAFLFSVLMSSASVPVETSDSSKKSIHSKVPKSYHFCLFTIFQVCPRFLSTWSWTPRLWTWLSYSPDVNSNQVPDFTLFFGWIPPTHLLTKELSGIYWSVTGHVLLVWMLHALSWSWCGDKGTFKSWLWWWSHH